MSARWQQLANWVDALSLRERAAVLLMVIAVLVFLWYQLLMLPLQAVQTAKQEQITAQQARLAKVNEALTSLLTQPAGASAAERARLESELARLNDAIGTRTGELIGPQEMTRVLEEVLAKNTRLRLVEVKSLPPEPLFEDVAGGNVYRHGVAITVQGSYLDTLGYLRALEALPWHFYWDSLDLHTVDYPANRTTLVVYTLSMEEGLLGV